jgi:hypothetical protein
MEEDEYYTAVSWNLVLSLAYIASTLHIARHGVKNLNRLSFALNTSSCRVKLHPFRVVLFFVPETLKELPAGPSHWRLLQICAYPS